MRPVSLQLKGIASLNPEASNAFALIALLQFSSDAAFQSAWAHTDAALLRQDIANFSSVTPTIQLNDALEG